MIITEFAPTKKNYLYEGLDLDRLHTVRLWESVGQQIIEAELTTQQIQQLFANIEQGANAQLGGNRTMLGKGKDAASAVNRAWEDLKTKVQDSGPIKGVDALYDKAAEKLKQATGGDAGVMQYVQKYRDFAKKHPVAQSLIYSALIAAAGISGAGLGGAAALGLFKMTDKLLQGEKFSSATYQGAKTGAMAYGASKIGDMMKGDPEAASNTSDLAQDMKDNPMLAQRSGYSTQSTGQTGDFGQPTYNFIPGSNQTSGALSGITGDQMVSHPAYQAVIQKFGNNVGARKAAMAAAKAAISRGEMNESVQLSKSQIYLVIGTIVDRYNQQVNEGIMDTIKGAAGKAASWAKTKGTNLTTKITADKLLQAWKKAGSPTDSVEVYKLITGAGVPTQVAADTYSAMKIPMTAPKGGAGAFGAMSSQLRGGPQQAGAAPSVKPSTAGANAFGGMAAQLGAKPAAQAQPTAQPTAQAQPTAAQPTAAQPTAAQPAAQLGAAKRSAYTNNPYAVQSAPAQATTQAQATTPALATQPAGFNAANVMKMPGMEKYAKPAAPAKTPNFAGPGGYGKVSTSFKTGAPAVPKAPAAPASPASPKQPITIGGQKILPTDPAYDKIMGKATVESLTWSKNFDPGMTLLRKMRK